MMKNNHNQGVTLIELLLYIAILATTLGIIFDLFAQTSLNRISSINESSILINSQKIMYDLNQTIRQANNIDLPAGANLSLNNHQISYSLDADGNLIKTENSESNKLNNSDVALENLNFEVLGPSTFQPTIKISFTLRSTTAKQGQIRKEDFQTSVSLR